jgi:hypothetical protein
MAKKFARELDFRATEHKIASHVLWPMMREVPARSASRGAAKQAEVFGARNYRQGFPVRGYGRVVPWLMAGH